MFLPLGGKEKDVYKSIICDFETLYKSYRKARTGKAFHGSNARFQMMSLEGIHMLKEQLEKKTYRVSPYNEFKIYEPKERVIQSCSFKDKIVQHCLCDNVLHPVLAKRFIECNYAGQIGKGTLFGMNKLKEHMEEHYFNYGMNGWILKCDIKKFFYRIDHEVLKDIVDYHFPDEYLVWLNHLFIDSTENPGLPLGNQVAQVYALLMLDCVDHMITEGLGIKYYGRYMDDFYLIHEDKNYLKYCLDAIREMVGGLKLELNGKTQIVPFKKGLRFLGFHHYITKDGKYIRKLSNENKRRIKRKVRRWSNAVETGKMSKEKFYQRYNAWKNHAMHGNCYQLCRSMDNFVDELLRRENDVADKM